MAAPDLASERQHWGWLHRAMRSTRWSLVKRVHRPRSEDAAGSADEFCRCYWYPLYAYLRRKGYRQEDAEDYVQSFLTNLLRDELLAGAHPEKGRLRNYLITLLNRHVAARRERDGAKKRGGGASHVPFEWQSAEATFLEQGLGTSSPDDAFRRALAARLVADGIASLRKHYAESDRLNLFDELLPALEGPLPDTTYAAVADRLAMRPGAVRTAAVRMRERFRLCVKRSASLALGIPDGPGLDAELRELFCSPVPPATL